MTLLLGFLAFLLFFLSDLNDVRLRCRPLIVCFPLGGILLAAATVISCARHSSPLPTELRIVCAVLGAGFLGLMIVALFFSLPADEAYVDRKEGRSAVTGGLYALCRHPGVLFFIPAYACISASFGLPHYEAILYSLLNILLILFEDLYVFPRVLSGYAAYRSRTPFLIPNRRGIVQCFRDYRQHLSRRRDR